MERNALSDRFAIFAAVMLLAVVLINDARLTLIASVTGLAAGLWVATRGPLTRVALVAGVALSLALGFAIFQLLL